MALKNVFRLIFLFTLTLLIPALSKASGSPAEAPDKAAEEIRAALEGWTKDFNDKNTNKICGLFAPDLIANYGDFPQISYESICKQLKSSLTDPELTFHYDLDLKEVIVAGDVAVVRLIWTLTVTNADCNVVETTKNRGMDIFRRQPDGAWRISRYIAYPMGGGRIVYLMDLIIENAPRVRVL